MICEGTFCLLILNRQQVSKNQPEYLNKNVFICNLQLMNSLCTCNRSIFVEFSFLFWKLVPQVSADLMRQDEQLLQTL